MRDLDAKVLLNTNYIKRLFSNLFKIHFKVCWSKVKKKNSPKGEAVQLWEKMLCIYYEKRSLFYF